MIRPVGLQRKRVKGFRLESPNGLPIKYVGRPSRWGNPFIVGEYWRNLAYWIAAYGVMTQDQINEWYANDGYLVKDSQDAVRLYKDYVHWTMDGEHGLKAWLDPLRGCNLACFCPIGTPCHRDVLLEIIYSKEEKP